MNNPSAVPDPDRTCSPLVYWWYARLYDWLIASLWSLILAALVYSAASRVVVTEQGLILRWGGQIFRPSFAATLSVCAVLLLIAFGLRQVAKQCAATIGRQSLRIVLIRTLQWLVVAGGVTGLILQIGPLSDFFLDLAGSRPSPWLPVASAAMAAGWLWTLRDVSENRDPAQKRNSSLLPVFLLGLSALIAGCYGLWIINPQARAVVAQNALFAVVLLSLLREPLIRAAGDFVASLTGNSLVPSTLPPHGDYWLWEHVHRIWCSPVSWLCVIPLLVASAFRNGPDAHNYRRWVDVVTSGHLAGFPSPVLSPVGVPVWQWSAGPGLLLAVPWKLTAGGFEIGTSARIVVVLMACLTIYATARFLYFLSDRNMLWAVAGFGALWFGTATAYYATAYSSEQMALCAMSVLGLLLCVQENRGPGSQFAAGAVAGLLIMIRPNLVLFSLPTLFALWWRGVYWDGFSVRNALRGTLLMGIPPLLAIWQVGTVNFWMTGDWRISPYSFGDANFRSIDLWHPQWVAILLHPLHGAFVYHPLILLGIVAQVWLSLRADDWRERAVWAWFLLASILTAWLHASWMCWWLATNNTFAMRGLAIPGAVAAVAFVRGCSLYASRLPPDSRSVLQTVVATTALLCVLWSWVLLQAGPTDFVTYGDLFRGWFSIFATWVQEFGPLRLTAAALVVRMSPFYFPRHSQDGSASTALLMRQRALANVSLIFLTDGLLEMISTNAFQIHWILREWVITAAIVPWLIDKSRKLQRWPGTGNWADCIATLATVMLFAGAIISFTGLQNAIPETRRHLVGCLHSFPWQLPFYVPEVQATYEDYQKIPGFQAEKQLLSEFLKRHNAYEKLSDQPFVRDCQPPPATSVDED